MAARKTTTKKDVGVEFKDKKFTMSKVIIFVSYIIGISLTIITIYGVFKGFEISALSVVTAAAYAEIAASNAFYYNKAKKENALKIALSAADKLSAEKVEDVTKIVNSLGGIV